MYRFVRGLNRMIDSLQRTYLPVEKPIPPSVPLSLSQAVQLAETFIAQNGYTDLPPIQDRRRLAFESLDGLGGLAIDHILEIRHNELQRHAYSYGGWQVRKRPGWTIVFLYTKDPKNGRAVTMNRDGSEIEVQHLDVRLSAFTPLLRK